jgi:SAM-dependent methyltransferase/protein-disulfide isomerase-like protein with CxxC motif
LEPVLRRLKEVYGDQIEIRTRMGGVFDDRSHWLVKYGHDDASLPSWVADCMTVTGMPMLSDYMGRAGVLSTYPACLAFKAAERQSHAKADLLLRLLLEASCLNGFNVSKDPIIAAAGEKAGLDTARLLKDMRSSEVQQAFSVDRSAMEANEASFLWSRITGPSGDSVVIEEVFAAGPYEEAVDRVSAGALRKRTPTDILEYASRHPGNLCAREVAEVFRTTSEDAERRLAQLSAAGHFAADVLPFGHLYRYQRVPRETLSIQEVQLSHVLEKLDPSASQGVNELIRKAVQGLYTEVATEPNKEYHFPLGRKALIFAGYPEVDIDRLPKGATESFAGVGYPHLAGALKTGSRVLDIGSGSGTDVLFAALKVGPGGEVVGLDITPAQIEKARAAIREAGAKNVRIEEANVEAIPLPNSSVDVVTSNGVLNLVPDKPGAFREIFRVLKPGGTLQLADIVTREDVAKACGLSPQLWADCIGGAAVEADYLGAIRAAGFKDVEILRRLDYFGQSANENTRRLTKSFGAESIVVRARRP